MTTSAAISPAAWKVPRVKTTRPPPPCPPPEGEGNLTDRLSAMGQPDCEARDPDHDYRRPAVERRQQTWAGPFGAGHRHDRQRPGDGEKSQREHRNQLYDQ